MLPFSRLLHTEAAPRVPAALVVQTFNLDFMGKGIERQVDNIADVYGFTVFDFRAVYLNPTQFDMLCARERVLKKRAAQSHLSSRMAEESCLSFIRFCLK